MQAQVPPHRRAADPRAQQQGRRLERPAGHDHARRPHCYAGAAPALRVAVDALHPGRAPALDQYALGEATYDRLGAVLDGVREVGLGGRLLGAALVSEADVAGGLGRVAGLVDVARDGPERPAERLGAAPHRLLGSVQVRAAVVDREPLPDGVEMAVEVGRVEPLEAMLAGPLLSHPGLGPQAVGPVDRRPAAEARAGIERDVHVRGGVGAAAPVEVLVGPELVLVEVRLVEEAAHVEHDHPLAGLGERRGDHAAARARAHDHGVRLVAGLLALRHDRRHGPLARLWDAAGARVAEGLPERVAPRLRVGQAVGEEQTEGHQRPAAGGSLGTERLQVAEDLLARAPRGRQETHPGEAVEELLEAVALQGRHRLDRLGEGFRCPHVAAAASPEAVRVVGALDRRADRVADRAQHIAPGLVHLGASSRANTFRATLLADQASSKRRSATRPEAQSALADWSRVKPAQCTGWRLNATPWLTRGIHPSAVGSP